MPVISPRRSSTSNSGSLYGTSSSGTGSTGTSTASAYSSASSYLNRANSLSKPTTPSSSLWSSSSSGASKYTPNYYSSYLGSNSSSYSPRTASQRNSLSSLYLSGGSSGLGTYRSSSSYLSAGSNDPITSSRYGLPKSPKTSSDTLRKRKDRDTNNSNDSSDVNGGGAKKPPSGSDGGNKRLSGSYSSSSLARLVATSGLEIYEKYSPANYKPNCELPRSSSALTEAEVDAVSPTIGGTTTTTTNNDELRNETTTNITLDRPRSRYSRLYSAGDESSSFSNSKYSDSSSKNDNDLTSTTATKPHRSSYRERAAAAAAATAKQQANALAPSTSASSVLSHSSSSGDVPTATFTLRSNRTPRTTVTKAEEGVTLNNGDKSSKGDSISRQGSKTNLNSNNNSYTNDLENNLRELKLSNSGSGSGLYKDSSSGSITTFTMPLQAKKSLSTSNSSGHLSALTTSNNDSDSELKRNHSANNLDVVDHSAPTYELKSNSAAAGGAEVCASATLNMVDSPITAKKIRSTALRSIPPAPPSPTASRYRDRDSRLTSSSVLSSSLSNNIDDASKSKDENAEGLCGLRNIGNTCFMNSVIQCLSHTSELTKFLRTHNGIRSTSSKDQQILQEFAKLIREMWTSNVHSVTPMDLKRAFSSKHRMYSDYNQQDAQEFLRFFLDSLHSALNSGVKGEHLKIDDNLSDNKKADLTWEWYTRHENSLIRDLFVGQLKSTLRCTTCGNTSVTFDPFWDLSVSLPSSSRCKLESCLDLFIREEVLDGDEMPTCAKCRQRRRCTKSFTIQRFPKYLVIHLKRFSETRWSKLSNIVEFPTGERELNMGPYGSNPGTSIYYSLYAISNHMGSTAGGHYVALCKHPVSRKWHEFNDNVVSDTLSENNLVSSSAYILFYERA
ncbi:ubiquitin carboxyl-terminal hydrolase Usp2 isoform X2 [Bactrocera dorsalis]|uniref:Ubiquitin carboxyl-terminal hydrolase n=1 Tax=Bactrocera dorsalis TaxID=27457 RepID=A0A8N4QEW3_BACDO|nr:ubiquitin carboxyl-terminal hydrolase Usp2 isoform X2 [Bactrocera dorsalis]XP_029405231.2 ubiquitin carboxyl-terminal hydrolase Usp2 isoform X2 [Bactrocera dorsalis]XP_029405232.2 ubiquitin carboxyl-terminal hydrolase Usp2 isoform X2 [Bactrocera dorsalis]XP_049311510.1 ubiquitin carboxyl-terminal hydrolase Usp2 isoform X2 [Bactrocera dorsalis]